MVKAPLSEDCTSKLTVSVPMPQIHCYLKADSKCPNAANSLLSQSWRWVSQCLKFIVTSKLAVSVPMPQIHCYLKADGECPDASNSLLPQTDGECPYAANSSLPQSWRWVSQCRKFFVTSKLTVSVPMPVPYMLYQNVKQCGRLAARTCDTRPATSFGLRGDDTSM